MCLFCRRVARREMTGKCAMRGWKLPMCGRDGSGQVCGGSRHSGTEAGRCGWMLHVCDGAGWLGTVWDNCDWTLQVCSEA